MKPIVMPCIRMPKPRFFAAQKTAVCNHTRICQKTRQAPECNGLHCKQRQIACELTPPARSEPASCERKPGVISASPVMKYGISRGSSTGVQAVL